MTNPSRIFSDCWMWSKQQSGAAEACWAHNPEVGGSKPSSAMYPSDYSGKFFLSSSIFHQIVVATNERKGREFCREKTTFR